MGIPELLDGIDTVVVAVGLFAIGETLYVAARYKFEKEEIYALSRLDVDEQGGLGAILEAVAARHAAWAFRSVPCRPAAARFRPSCPT